MTQPPSFLPQYSQPCIQIYHSPKLAQMSDRARVISEDVLAIITDKAEQILYVCVTSIYTHGGDIGKSRCIVIHYLSCPSSHHR